MRSLIAGFALLVFSTLSMAQEIAGVEVQAIVRPPGTPVKETPVRSFGFMRPQQVKALVKHQLKKAIDGRPYPNLENWHPLTTRQKFDVFVAHTYSPNPFLVAGLD